MQDKFEGFITRYEELSKKLEEDPRLYQEYGKEYGWLTEIIDMIKNIKQFDEDISGYTLMLEEADSSDMKNALIEEIQHAEKNRDESLNALKDKLLDQNAQYENAILEIRPGTGGEESCLFADDLLNMYLKYAQLHNWKTEVQYIQTTDYGGIKEAVIAFKHKDAYKYLQFESGVHRVQRVPKTEAAGRIHTSAVTVAVLPEEKAIEIKIDERDLKIDVYRSGGNGGQSVNTTDSAVRITHLPTGIVVAQQDERSQLQNKQKAMRILQMRIYQKMQDELDQARDESRKQQVGSGDRSDRIRTYNFNQNRVTDHRLQKSWLNLPGVLCGEILHEIMTDLYIAKRDGVLICHENE